MTVPNLMRGFFNINNRKQVTDMTFFFYFLGFKQMHTKNSSKTALSETENRHKGRVRAESMCSGYSTATNKVT